MKINTNLNVPTDNLYKFIAIFSLILFIVTFIIGMSFLSGIINDSGVDYFLNELKSEENTFVYALLRILLALNCFLIFTSIAAFTLWYFRLQRYKDLVVLLDAKKAEIELDWRSSEVQVSTSKFKKILCDIDFRTHRTLFLGMFILLLTWFFSIFLLPYYYKTLVSTSSAYNSVPEPAPYVFSEDEMPFRIEPLIDFDEAVDVMDVVKIPNSSWNELNSVYFNNEKDTLREIQKLIPMDLFSSGPHDGIDLEFESGGNFGHYNPDFIRWASTNVEDLMSNTLFVNTTFVLYKEKYKHIVDDYVVVYDSMKAFPDEISMFRDEYKILIKQRKLPDDFLSIVNDEKRIRPYFKTFLTEKTKSRAVIHIMAFWIRREIDGSDEEIYKMLNMIQESYK